MMFVLIIALSTGVNFAVADSERNITGKLAVITGAAQGIGYAIADHFLENGARKMLIVDKNFTKGFEAEDTLKCKYGDDKVEYIRGDITTDLEVLYKMITETYGYVDVLVNDAGIANETDVRLTMMTNALGTIEWSLKFRELMRTDKGGNGGTIINIASVSGFTIDPFLVTYKASKYAVVGFSKGLGHPFNYRNTGVRVFTICPGQTRTAMTTDSVPWDDQETAFRNAQANDAIQSPDVLGKAAVKLFSSAETGTAWEVTDGVLSVAPLSVESSLSEVDQLVS